MRKQTSTVPAKRDPTHTVHTMPSWSPYSDPDGAITLEEWRRSVAKAPAVQVVEVHDHLVA